MPATNPESDGRRSGGDGLGLRLASVGRSGGPVRIRFWDLAPVDAGPPVPPRGRISPFLPESDSEGFCLCGFLAAGSGRTQERSRGGVRGGFRGRLARFDSADDLAIGNRAARPAIPDCGGAGGLPLPPPLAAGSAEVTTVSPPPSGGNAAALLASRAVRGRFARFDATDSVAESPAAPAVVAGGPAAHPASAAVPSIAISPAPPLSASAVLAQRAVHGQSRLMRYDSADDLAGS